MNREIKFQVICKNKILGIERLNGSQWEWTYFELNPDDFVRWVPGVFGNSPDLIRRQYTGLKDKNGKEIYEGDEVQYKKPYRTTQTHTGDNIPNGSYTEPMEPGIKIISGVIIFSDGSFILDNGETDIITPLSWHQINWDLESIKDSISWTRQTDGWFDDPEEGDLQYLINDCAKVETPEQLVEYLSGFEIIGNIYENPELIISEK